MFECLNEDMESFTFEHFPSPSSFEHSLIPTFEHFFCASTVATAAINTATTRGTKPIRRHLENAESSAETTCRPNASATIAATEKMPQSARIRTSEFSIKEYYTRNRRLNGLRPPLHLCAVTLPKPRQSQKPRKNLRFSEPLAIPNFFISHTYSFAVSS